VQLVKADTDSCMQVAERAAELRHATAVQVCASQVASRDRMITVAERIAKQDRAMYKAALRRAEQAKAVLEMTKLHVGDGMKRGEARKQAMLDVYRAEAAMQPRLQ
jgi:hypothetical protein